MLDIQNYRLGETNELLTLETSEQHREVAIAMAQQAHRSIHIFTHDLDNILYDNAAFDEAVSRLLRSSPQAHLQILVQDSDRAMRSGHRLINLAQRLSSKIEIRKPIPEYRDIARVFFVADETGYISRPLATRYEGVANFSDRLSARDLADFFREVWERSQPDSALRRLYI